MAVALSHTLPLVPVEVSKPNRPWELRFHLLLLTAAVVIGSSLQTWGPAWSRTIFEHVRLDSFSSALALVLALLASVSAHELGHLIAALFLDYAVLGGAIGPFQFEWSQNKVTFRMEAGNWARCSISAVPREMHNGWRGRMMMVVTAGPAVSLLFLLAASGVVLRGHSTNWLLSFWSCCGEVNFFLFILGLVPNGRFASVRNDAELFLALWQNDADARDMFICHQAIELSLRGIRPEDYPEALLAELASFQGRPYTRLIVARRMVEWATDSGNITLAGEWDQAALAAGGGCSLRAANIARAESACFDVLFREDMRAAVRKFADVNFEQLFPLSLAERALAARLIARGLPERAPAHVLLAQYNLPLGNPYYNHERMLLAKLHEKALWQIQRAVARH